MAYLPNFAPSPWSLFSSPNPGSPCTASTALVRPHSSLSVGEGVVGEEIRSAFLNCHHEFLT